MKIEKRSFHHFRHRDGYHASSQDFRTKFQISQQTTALRFKVVD